jgi:hypothetical protein
MRFHAITLAAIGFLAAIPGCSHTSSRPDDHCIAPPGVCANPEAALLALKQAYNTRESAALDSLLAADFTFELSPEDAGQPGVPDEWGRSVELALHALLLDAGYVHSLELNFVIGPRVFDAVEQLWTITITDVHLDLYGVTPDRLTTPEAYGVDDGSAKFWFRSTAWNAPCSDESAWKIVKWRDQPVEWALRRGPALPPDGITTWGYIKWLYHPEP